MVGWVSMIQARYPNLRPEAGMAGDSRDRLREMTIGSLEKQSHPMTVHTHVMAVHSMFGLVATLAQLCHHQGVPAAA